MAAACVLPLGSIKLLQLLRHKIHRVPPTVLVVPRQIHRGPIRHHVREDELHSTVFGRNVFWIGRTGVLAFIKAKN